MAKIKKNVSQNVKNSKAAAAGMARATAGRSRIFDGKKSKLAAANTGDAEIDEGLEEYSTKKAMQPEIKVYAVSIGMVVSLQFDKEEKTGDALKKAIAEELIAHPAWNDLSELPEFIWRIDRIKS